MQKILRFGILLGFFISIFYLLFLLYKGGDFVIGSIVIRRAEIATAVIVICLLGIVHCLLAKRNGSRGIARRSILLFCGVLILYMANYRTKWASDTVPARYLPFSILREANFDLDEFRNLYSKGTLSNIRFTGKHYVSTYPVGAALLALPFSLPAAMGEALPSKSFGLDLEKFSAATIVALSVLIFYRLLLRLTDWRNSLFLALIYAVGTSSFSVSSQGLWQHGPSQLAIVSAIYCVVRGRQEPRWIGYAGLPCAFAVVCRPTDLLIVFGIVAYVLFYHRKWFAIFLLSALPPAIFEIWYNLHYFGNPFHSQFPLTASWLWSVPVFDGLGNILLSPGRGLLIYSPIFIFSFAGLAAAFRSGGDPLLRYLGLSAVLIVLLYSKFFMWWGGYTYGPRLLADITPILTLCLYPIMDSIQITIGRKVLFGIFAVWSMTAHAVGVYADNGSWNAAMDVDNHPERLWNWKDNQLVNSPKRLFARAVISVNQIPTTRNAPSDLNVTYTSDLPRYIVTFPSSLVRFHLEAKNDGHAVWLSWPYGKPGTIVLQCQWIKGKRVLLQLTETRILQRDVFPGQTYPFDLTVEAPNKAGQYVFEVGLRRITEERAMISPLPLLRVPVTIVNSESQ